MALDLHFEPVESAPIPSATVMLLRDAPDGSPGVQVLMMRRHGNSRDLGGAHVFPGGKLDPLDCPDATTLDRLDRSLSDLCAELAEPATAPEQVAGLYLAALRETLEECGLLPGQPLPVDQVEAARLQLKTGAGLLAVLESLGLRATTDSLRPWARWITPRMASMTRRRFDARFFVARALRGQEARHDDHEATEAQWWRPHEALRHYQGGEMDLAPPQLVCLCQLGRHASVDAVFAQAASRPPHLVEPAPFDDAGVRTICYPGDPRHPQMYADWDAPSRVVFRHGRFEPEGGLGAWMAAAA